MSLHSNKWSHPLTHDKAWCQTPLYFYLCVDILLRVSIQKLFLSLHCKVNARVTTGGQQEIQWYHSPETPSIYHTPPLDDVLHNVQTSRTKIGFPKNRCTRNSFFMCVCVCVCVCGLFYFIFILGDYSGIFAKPVTLWPNHVDMLPSNKKFIY